jgi:hypothetical protein
MTHIAEYLQQVDVQDEQFIGTIAFRSEEETLPDGSKIALGIDDGHWVLVYQKEGHIKVYEYNLHKKKILLDKNPGKTEEINHFFNLVQYFFGNANIEELVTFFPPRL